LLAAPAGLGALVGALLLLVLPQRVFRGVVPVLIMFAVVLVIAQPWLSRHVTGRVGGAWTRVALPAGVFLTAIYGGYFGAAQGVILISLLAVLLTDPLQELNALKNVLAAIVNGVAATYFLFAATVAWEPAVLIALSSIAGGQAGAAVGRRLSPVLLRAVIIVAGVIAVLKVLTSQA
jgi:uncharacterized membrane protein YfcA